MPEAMIKEIFDENFFKEELSELDNNEVKNLITEISNSLKKGLM
jgi:rubrerythrin